MALDPKKYYNKYWVMGGRARREARSRERALLTLDLLRSGGVRNGRLLDVGCGPGWALEVFKAAGYEAVGVDASSVALEDARSRGLDVRGLDLERDDPALALGPEARFSAVVSLEVLEHLVHPLGLLQKLRGLLAQGGLLVVSLPNEITLPARLRVLLGKLPFGGHDDPHLRHFDRARALALFDSARLRVTGERRVSLFPVHWQTLRALTRPLLRLCPGALALATVFLLEVREPQETDAK